MEEIKENKITRRDKVILKMLADYVATTSRTTSSNAITIDNTTSQASDALEIYNNILDDIKIVKDGDTIFDKETKEIKIYYDHKWYAAPVDYVIDVIRKKNQSIYETLEEMIDKMREEKQQNV